MGCDIHTALLLRNKKTNQYDEVISIVASGDASTTVDIPHHFRNYNIFGMLADGVRGVSYPFSIPIRGRFNKDRVNLKTLKTYDAKTYFDESISGVDAHSHSFLYPGDFDKLDTQLKKVIRSIKKRKTFEYQFEDMSIFEIDRKFLKFIVRQIEIVAMNTWLLTWSRNEGDPTTSLDEDDWVLLIYFDN